MSIVLTAHEGQPAVFVPDHKGQDWLYLCQVLVDIPGRWVLLLSKLSDDRAELLEAYEVSCNGAEWGCGCRDWLFRHRRCRTGGSSADCKHIATAKDFRAAVAALKGAVSA